MSAVVERPRRPNPLLLAIGLAFTLTVGVIMLVIFLVAVELLESEWLQLPGARGTRDVDVWWLLAAGSVCLLLAPALAWWARAGVRAASSAWDARKWPLILLAAALLAVLLYAPGSWSLLLAVAALFVGAVWRLALTPRPAPRWRPRGRELWWTVALGTFLALTATSYAALHPLNATFEGRTDDEWSLMGATHTPPRTFELLLENEANRAVTLRSLRVPDVASGIQLRIHGGIVHGHDSDTRFDPLRPLAGVVLADEPLLVELRLTRARCAARPATSVRFARVEARFETLGVTRTQQFTVEPPGVLRCR